MEEKEKTKMKATEIRDLIFESERKLHIISEAIAVGPEYDGIDRQYLKSKMSGIINTATHIAKYQLK